MNNVLALIDLYDGGELGLLTNEKPLASTTFLGRYAFIDFVLSNLSNSGIDQIGVLVKNHANSIYKHISNTNTYLANPKTGSLNLLINEKGILNPVFNTDLNNIRENDYLLYDDNIQYVLVTNSSFIMKIDYKQIIKEHINSGKAVSLVYKNVDDTTEFADCLRVVSDSLNNVQKSYKSKAKESTGIVLNTMVIDRKLFLDLIKKINTLSVVYDMDDLATYLANFVTQVNLIEYKGIVKYFDSFKKYYRYSLDFLNDEKLMNDYFNDPKWTFYTTTHDSRPVMYGEKAKVSNSLISNGSTILGTVKNSIISRDVVIEEGASVENSIIFTHCVIKKGVSIKNVVADKRVVFANREEVFGTTEEPLYFPRGVNV